MKLSSDAIFGIGDDNEIRYIKLKYFNYILSSILYIFGTEMI